jgi:hypothetical protein
LLDQKVLEVREHGKMGAMLGMGTEQKVEYADRAENGASV